MMLLDKINTYGSCNKILSLLLLRSAPVGGGGRQYYSSKASPPPPPLPPINRRRHPNEAITHCIFDFDGVLLDTERIFYDVNARCLHHFSKGKHQYNNTLKQGQMGRKLDEGVAWLLSETGLLSEGVKQGEFIEMWKRLLVEEMKSPPKVMPGARKLIQHLARHRIDTAICTGSDSQEFAMKTRHCKDLISSIRTLVLTGDDPEVKQGKPDPQPYLVTMRRMDVVDDPKQHSRVLVFEDAINGAMSGIAAGTTVLLVPQKEFQPDDWAELCKPIESQLGGIIDSLEDFNPEEYGLPPYA